MKDMPMKTTSEETPANMSSRFWGFLTDPHSSVDDVGERRRAKLLSSLTLIVVAALILETFTTTTTRFIIYLAVSLVAYAFSRSPYFQIGAYILSFGFTSIAYVSIYRGTASSIDSAINSTVPISLILASALLSQRGFVTLSIAAVAASFALTAYADPQYLSDPNFIPNRTAGIVLTISALLIGITVFRTRIERDRLKQVNDANRKLEELATQLESRIEQRTKELNEISETTARRAAQLQTIAELAQAIAQVQNPNDIFTVAAKLISERFGFYHVGIFLIDRDREFAVLQSANSAGGQKMLERGHRLALGTGVVGFSAQTGKPRLALDVGEDAVFFNNPDLPETRSEIALPLMYGEQAIGVLDVQSTEPRAFSEEDFRVLGTLANQLAIAIENARLLSEARASARQVEEVYNEFVRTQWSRSSQRMEFAGFRYNAGRIEMLETPADGADAETNRRQAAASADPAVPSDAKRGRVEVPVKLRGEIIGMLRVDSNDPSKIWRSDEISLMAAVAERAALALENARLFQDARRRAAKERMIAEATSHISNSLNIENILQATAAELERALGGSEVLIRFTGKDSS